jgi:hypothetical protein
MRAAFWVALSAQVLSLLVISLGDIGFDHPGRYGLDFDDLLLLAMLWLAASFVSFFTGWALRERGLLRLFWFALALQLFGAWLALA